MNSRTKTSLNNLSRNFSILYCLVILAIYAMITVNIFVDDQRFQDILDDVDTDMDGELHKDEYVEHLLKEIAKKDSNAIKKIQNDTIESFWKIHAENKTTLDKEDHDKFAQNLHFILNEEHRTKLHSRHTVDELKALINPIDGSLGDEFTNEVTYYIYLDISI